MYKQFLFFMLFIMLYFNINAQKGFNELSIHGEAIIPILQNEQGFGFSLKGSFGMGKSGLLTLSAGVSKFISENSIETGKITTRLVPFLVGYKQNIQKFFIEPKIGFGELGGRIAKESDYARPSAAAIFGGLGAGYMLKRFTIGINFLAVRAIENSSAGIWYNKNFNYTSIAVGYSLLSKKRH